MSNIDKHISDAAKATDFDPTGTDWPQTTTNVQDALASLGGYCIKDKGLPLATKESPGVIKLATVEDVTAGTNDDKAVTPKLMVDFVTKPEATTTTLGSVMYSTNAEGLTPPADQEKVITSKVLDYVFNNRMSTEAVAGALKVATADQAKTGTDDTVLMTPKKVQLAIAAIAPTVATATETQQGTVKIATVAEIQAGEAHDGVAISPKGFAGARGTDSAYGTFKAAQPTHMAALNAKDMAVTPWVLGQTKASVSSSGIVDLSINKVADRPNTALAANANVVSTTGDSMTGNLLFRGPEIGIVFESNTDYGHITFQSKGDSDPDTRMEFNVGDNGTEYFRWVADIGSAQGKPQQIKELMRLKQNGGTGLIVQGAIYDGDNSRVYSPNNRPSAADFGAMSNYWGATQWTDYLNYFDKVVNWECPANSVMVGVYSYHDDGYEDRRFRYKYKRIG